MILKPKHPRAQRSGYVYEHIVKYEEYHKCCILPWINVHHLDKDKKNNKPENLVLVNPSNHSKIHRLEERTRIFDRGLVVVVVVVVVVVAVEFDWRRLFP
jgi:HNH endonuclease